MLDFSLNSGFSPANDYYVVIDGRSYMGRLEGSAAKVVVFDFDGVVEKRGANPLYESVRKELGVKNKEVGRRNNEIWSCLGRLKTPADVPAVEDEIGSIYTECGLTYQQYIDANNDAAKEFIKHDIVKGAKACIRRLDDEMGYTPVVISGCYKPALDVVCDHLGILQKRVYGTTLDFYGNTVRPRLMLGDRKPEAKGDVMERTVGTRHGCCVVINDNPSPLEDPVIKAGINPSIITGDFKRSELPFDVTVPCPEAREDLTRLIPPIYRYEYGWVVTRTTDVLTEHEAIGTASAVRAGLTDTTGVDSDRVRFRIASEANRLLELKEKSGLVRNVDAARNMLARFLVSEGADSKVLAGEILDYFYKHMPEMRAEREMLSDLI
jgi:hypothetical protein